MSNVSLFDALSRTGGDNTSSDKPSAASDKSTQPNKPDREKKPEPYSTRRLSNLFHSAYYPEFLSTLEGLTRFISLTNSLKQTPQLQINAISKANLIKAPKTQTKISDEEIDYLPALYSATMIKNGGPLYEQLNTHIQTSEAQKANNNGFLLSSEAQNGHNASPLITRETNKVLRNIEKMLVTAVKYLGFHEVSGAKYAALAVYGNDDNHFHDFALSSNNDPKFKDFDNPKMRRCAEDSLRLLAKENQLDDKKLKSLFLMREPYPDGYGDNNDGVFNFSKLVPCKSCLQHLEKLYKDGGNLIIVASLNQGKFLEESLNLAERGQSQQKNYLLKDQEKDQENNQEKDDIRITYPEGLKHCFIEIPNKNLPRIIVEEDTGGNVKSKGAQCQNSREVSTFGEWLRKQEILREAQESLVHGTSVLKEIADNQSRTRSLSSQNLY